MKLDTYRQALRYARSYEWATYKDVVHDAYLQWYNRTGKDLFDEPPHLVVAIVKYAIRNLYRSSRPTYMWRGEIYPNSYIPTSTEYEGGSFTPSFTIDYADVIDTEMQRLRLSLVLTAREDTILQKLEEGYKQSELAKEARITLPAIGKLVTRIRLKAIKLNIN